MRIPQRTRPSANYKTNSWRWWACSAILPTMMWLNSPKRMLTRRHFSRSWRHTLSLKALLSNDFQIRVRRRETFFLASFRLVRQRGKQLRSCSSTMPSEVCGDTSRRSSPAGWVSRSTFLTKTRLKITKAKITQWRASNTKSRRKSKRYRNSEKNSIARLENHDPIKFILLFYSKATPNGWFEK